MEPWLDLIRERLDMIPEWLWIEAGFACGLLIGCLFCYAQTSRAIRHCDQTLWKLKRTIRMVKEIEGKLES